LQGEAIPQPQNPKNYGFDLHPICFPFNHGVGTKDTEPAERLQVTG
jgi:hypothetical protein